MPVADPTHDDRSFPEPAPLTALPDRDWRLTPLPISLTSFVGREREVEDLVALLRRRDVRLITLTGPGGVGKTRLALHVTEQLRPEFPDGVTFVGLASVADPALVLPTIAQAFAVRDSGDRPLVERLRLLLGDRHILIVLDNFEHLMSATADLATLLTSCAGLTIFATSRSVLHLSGEQVFPVSPLAMKETGNPLNPIDVTGHDAVSLFCQRAHAADPAFALTVENAATIAEIVHRLDGLPLAIELAASRVRMLSPEALLARLSDQLRLLTGGARDLPARQHTMRDAIAWSYDLLTPAEQGLFRRLAVFAGGFTLEAAEVVGGEEQTSASTLDLLASLTDQSLVRRLEDVDGEPRYGILETIREYGLQQLVMSGDEQTARQRHANYFFAVVEAITPVPRWPPKVTRTRFLDVERDNVRATLSWFDQIQDYEQYLLFATRLFPLWNSLGHGREGRRWLEQGAVRAEAGLIFLRGLAFGHAGVLAGLEGDGETGLALLEECLALFGDVTNPTVDNRMDMAMMLRAKGNMLLRQGRYPEAEPLLEQSMAGFVELGDTANISNGHSSLAVVAYTLGDLERARSECEDAVALARAADSATFAANALGILGLIACELGHYRDAAASLEGAFSEGQAALDQTGTPKRLASAAVLAVKQGSLELATQLLAAADAQCLVLGRPHQQPERAAFEHAAADARSALGAARFAAVWADGASLSPEAATAEARAFLLTVESDPERAIVDPVGAFGLTHREVEVLRLVADGRTDREIADALFIGFATVRSHLANIYAKLDVRSRTSAIAAARRAGIL
jgi:non-specific serine/threonine protein kinase